jgi:hypothetical protein
MDSLTPRGDVLHMQHITMSRSRQFMAEQRQILLGLWPLITSKCTVARQQLSALWG